LGAQGICAFCCDLDIYEVNGKNIAAYLFFKNTERKKKPTLTN
jgi:hypothetical protein